MLFPRAMKEAAGFHLIFWGILFGAGALKINNFDLLHDPPGFLALAGGCYLLSRQAPGFAISFWLSLLCLGNSLVPENFAGPMVERFRGLPCALTMWCVAGGIISFLIARGWHERARKMMNLRLVHLTSTLFIWCLQWLSPVATGWYVFWFAAPFIVAGLVSFIMILLTVHRIPGWMDDKWFQENDNDFLRSRPPAT